MSAAPVVALFCGSREWSDAWKICRDLESLPEHSVVIQGGRRGAERIACVEARKLGIHVATMAPLGDYFGDSAPYRRNQALALLEPDVVYGYRLGHDPGTAQMMAVAEAKRIPVHHR